MVRFLCKVLGHKYAVMIEARWGSYYQVCIRCGCQGQ